MKVAKTWDELAEERSERRTRRQMLRQLLTKKFGPLSEASNARLDAISVDELGQLFEESIDAPSLEALGFTD